MDSYRVSCACGVYSRIVSVKLKPNSDFIWGLKHVRDQVSDDPGECWLISFNLCFQDVDDVLLVQVLHKGPFSTAQLSQANKRHVDLVNRELFLDDMDQVVRFLEVRLLLVVALHLEQPLYLLIERGYFL